MSEGTYIVSKKNHSLYFVLLNYFRVLDLPQKCRKDLLINSLEDGECVCHLPGTFKLLFWTLFSLTLKYFCGSVIGEVYRIFKSSDSHKVLNSFIPNKIHLSFHPC